MKTLPELIVSLEDASKLISLPANTKVTVDGKPIISYSLTMNSGASCWSLDLKTRDDNDYRSIDLDERGNRGH